jgi:hypothetical protein
MTDQNRFWRANLHTILNPRGTEESNVKPHTCNRTANQYTTIFGRTVYFHESKYPSDFLRGEFSYDKKNLIHVN